MRTILTLLLLAISFQMTFGREIIGTVVSDADSTAVTGAICKLETGGKVLEAVASDANGRFAISTLDKSALKLEVSMTGYAPAVIMIDAGGKNLNLGAIYLTEGVALGEVTVTASQMMQSGGRTIVFPSAADVRASSTSVSLFQKLPLAGLDVNPVHRTLTVDDGTPMILINGVPSSIDDVNSIQPKEIAKIEYSRLTPARYADRGKTGLINITLKARNDGGTVYVWGRSAVTTAFADGNIRGSYHQGPSQFSVSYRPSWRNYQKVFDYSEQSYIGDDFRTDLVQSDRNPFNYFMTPIQAKYNYRPNSSTLFSATYSFYNLTEGRSLTGETKDTGQDDYSTHNTQSGKAPSNSLDLFLREDFNERNALEVQIVGTLTNDHYFRDNHYDFAGGGTENYLADTKSHRRSLISEVSYTHLFSDKTSLGAGYQNTLTHSENRYVDSDYKPLLTENNNYVYVRLSRQFGSVYLSLSSGMKMFWTKNDLNKRHFIRNISTLQGSWNINNAWALQASLEYRPSIPSLSSLTDYPQQTTPYLISNGNPALKVSETIFGELIPRFKYRKFTTSLELCYETKHNPIFSDIVYTGDRLFLSQTVNGKSYTNYWATLSLGLKDIYGFGANVRFTEDRFVSEGEGWKHDLNSFSANWSLWWNKGDWTITYWQKIPGKSLMGHRVSKEENGNMLGVEYSPGEHWDIGVNWMYMFTKKGTQYPLWNYSSVTPGWSDRYIKHNGNMIVLTLSYSADFGTIFRSGRRSLNNSDRGSSILKF